jgi:hypothetical protein
MESSSSIGTKFDPADHDESGLPAGRDATSTMKRERTTEKKTAAACQQTGAIMAKCKDGKESEDGKKVVHDLLHMASSSSSLKYSSTPTHAVATLIPSSV